MANNNLHDRLGLPGKKSLDGVFPENGRIALVYVLERFQSSGMLTSWDDIEIELLRLGRFKDKTISNKKDTFNSVRDLLLQLDWIRVCIFCERVYSQFLTERDYYDSYVSLDQVRERYTREINLILEEENLAYVFENGLFIRKGHAQTQKAISRVGTVLGHPKLTKVRGLYNKATGSFFKFPEPDNENCIKDSVCALELCLEILTGEPAANDFAAVLKRLRGNEDRQIPAPIVECMLKIHGYRGSGQAVAHGMVNGNRVTSYEAELVLSIVASLITYLSDLLLEESEIPF